MSMQLVAERSDLQALRVPAPSGGGNRWLILKHITGAVSTVCTGMPS